MLYVTLFRELIKVLTYLIRISAGIPNITGNVGQTGYDNVPSGAFYQLHTSGGFQPGTFYFRDSAFDASRSNALYGASETVTPLSLATNYFIKY